VWFVAVLLLPETRFSVSVLIYVLGIVTQFSYSTVAVGE